MMWQGGGELELLKGITGAFRPGVLTALMGASGAGKVSEGAPPDGIFSVSIPSTHCPGDTQQQLKQQRWKECGFPRGECKGGLRLRIWTLAVQSRNV